MKTTDVYTECRNLNNKLERLKEQRADALRSASTEAIRMLHANGHVSLSEIEALTPSDPNVAES